MSRPVLAAFLASALAAPLRAQAPLGLGEAFRRADSAAFQNRIARGEVRARQAQTVAALQGVLPAIRLEGGYLRTDNPLGAFGFTLQQRIVTQAAFDPASLNHPTATGNWNAAVVAELPLVNVDAWLGRGAARDAAAAAAAGGDWTRATVRLDVVRAYYGAVLARAGVATLEGALAAADAHRRQAESAVRNGVATPSDALLASVQRGQVEAALLGARGDAGVARERLALLLGQPGDTLFILPDTLPDPARLGEATAGDAARADITAAQLGLQAAEADHRRATATLLPRLNAFGRYEWNDPSAPFGGEASYTVGLMASWSPFAGGARIAERMGASARRDAAAAARDAAVATAALEVSAARSDRDVARAQLAIATTAVTQASDAHRIVARKYDGGLATVAELLSAAATETATRLGLAAARYRLITAEAALRHATGATLDDLTALEN